MCSKLREDCSAIRHTECGCRHLDHASPCPVRDRPVPSDLDVQTLEHSRRRHHPALTSANADRIDHPCIRTMISMLDDHIRKPKVTVQQTGTRNQMHSLPQLPCHRLERGNVERGILQALHHGGTVNVVKLHAEETPRLRRNDLRTADHPGSRHADGGKPSGTTKLTGRLGDAHAVLQCRPRRDRPVLGGPASLAGWFDEPDAAQALLLQTGDGMFRRPGHGRSIAGRSVRVV